MVEQPTTLADVSRSKTERGTQARAIATAMKILVLRHFPEAQFETMREHERASNIGEAQFGPGERFADGTVRPPYVMLAFTIGPAELTDPDWMESNRKKLQEDLRDTFGAAARNVRFEPSAGSMSFQGKCTGTATAYGSIEALHASLLDRLGHDHELRFLLSRKAGAEPRRT